MLRGAPWCPEDENFFCAGHIGDRIQLWLGASHTRTAQWPVRQGWAPGTIAFYRGWKLREVLNLATQLQCLRLCPLRPVVQQENTQHLRLPAYILQSYKTYPYCWFSFPFYVYSVCVCHCAYVEVTGQLYGVGSLLPHVGSGDRTQAVRSGSKPLTHRALLQALAVTSSRCHYWCFESRSYNSPGYPQNLPAS